MVRLPARLLFIPALLPPLGELGVDLWQVRRQSRPLLTTEHTCACLSARRNILLFPMGNSNGQANDMVSVYLNYGDQKASEGWHVCAQFALAISNPHDPSVYIQSRASPPPPSLSFLIMSVRGCVEAEALTVPGDHAEAHHRFTNEEQDWGFTRFVELRKLFSVSEGRTKPIIENDETVITAFVRVLKDPTGVLWHNFHKCVPACSLSTRRGDTGTDRGRLSAHAATTRRR